MAILFTRHGESEANIGRVFSNRGWVHPLTPRGRHQALELANQLINTPIAKIYTSPVRRAVETSFILQKQLGYPPLELTEALREYDVGDLEGRGYADGSEALYWEITRDWLENGNVTRRFPNGENIPDMQARFVPLITHIIARAAVENVLLVGHGGLYRHMLPLVLVNIPANSMLFQHIDYATIIRAEVREHRLVCSRWGEQTWEGEEIKSQA